MVVLEARDRTTTFWAWCRVGDGAGVEEITFTRPDGSSPVTEDLGPINLGRVLFQYPLDTATPAGDPRPVVWTDEFLLGPDDGHPLDIATERMLGITDANRDAFGPPDVDDRFRVDVRPVRWRPGWRRVFATLVAEEQPRD